MYLIRPSMKIISSLTEAISSHPSRATEQCGISNKNVCQSVSGKHFYTIGQKKNKLKTKITTNT